MNQFHSDVLLELTDTYICLQQLAFCTHRDLKHICLRHLIQIHEIEEAFTIELFFHHFQRTSKETVQECMYLIFSR